MRSIAAYPPSPTKTVPPTQVHDLVSPPPARAADCGRPRSDRTSHTTPPATRVRCRHNPTPGGTTASAVPHRYAGATRCAADRRGDRDARRPRQWRALFSDVGAGFDARIVAKLNYRTKRTFGRGAYVYPVLKTLAEGPRFRCRARRPRFEASWVILSFATRYGSLFRLPRKPGWGAIRSWPSLWKPAPAGPWPPICYRWRWAGCPAGNEAEGRSCSAGQGRTHRPAETAPVEVDGDHGGMSPVEVQRRRTARSTYRPAPLCC